MSSPWLNTADAADYLRYTGKHPLLSVYKFIKRHGITTRHDGRRLLLARLDVERAVEGDGHAFGFAGQRQKALKSVAHVGNCPTSSARP